MTETNTTDKFQVMKVTSDAWTFEVVKRGLTAEEAENMASDLAIAAGDAYAYAITLDGDDKGEYAISPNRAWDHFNKGFKDALAGVPAGSWAETAIIMAHGDDSGFDWDAWKDEMKDREMGIY